MRQQYRFRGIGDDTHVWDVHRLARESQGLPVVEVALAEIAELHEADWFPDEHPATLQIVEHLRLIQAADPRDRILLCTDGRMVDGTHRLAKAASLGYPHIVAVRFPRPPRPDFLNVDEDDLPYDA